MKEPKLIKKLLPDGWIQYVVIWRGRKVTQEYATEPDEVALLERFKLIILDTKKQEKEKERKREEWQKGSGVEVSESVSVMNADKLTE